ncbi:hypothetical protein MNBD_GAMMA02-925 [hydrothermal vent metagenome]|uniref:General secretion pathway GspH domain-containing protein n=1 Tax=hydrothermal vent metagenome TaxID=652676 RepID=A0A3B0VZZ4_9ZZZZ
MHKLKNKNLTQKITGFTLVELITVLLIGSLLLAWGVPNYRDFKMRKQISTAANEVVYSLTQARAEAVRYGTDVRVSPAGGDWQNGWTTTSIGVDGNADVVLAIQDPIDPNLILTQVGALIGDVVFNRIGGLTGNSAGRFEIKSSDVAGFDRAVAISLTGSSKVVKI